MEKTRLERKSAMDVSRITMNEFEAALTRTRVAVLPLGSTEEHGAHLPLDTDTLQVVHTVKKAAEEVPFLALPPVHYGYCRSTRDHPGTVSISPATLGALLFDIGESLYRQGIRGIVFISGHAGKMHLAMIEEAAQELVDAFDDLHVAAVCEYHWAQEAGRAGLVETPDDGHAGEIETSRILALDPALVQGTSPEEYPSFPTPFLEREKRSAWPGGVWGDPAKASAEKGERLYAATAARLVELVKKMESKIARG
jgi:creatinine amidohydrolase